MKCPNTYREWVSMVDMENWENVCRLHEGFDSDSDLSPPRQMSPLWQPFENEGTFSDMRSRGPSEEYQCVLHKGDLNLNSSKVVLVNALCIVCGFENKFHAKLLCWVGNHEAHKNVPM